MTIERPLTIDDPVGARSGTIWADLFDDTADYGFRRARDLLRKWSSEYLIQPNSQLGRPGPVCPFVKPSIAKGKLYVGCIGGRNIDADLLGLAVADVFEMYGSLQGEAERDAQLLAMVTAFPDLRTYRVIDEVHHAWKSRFVEHGLMLGQFYPGCPKPGLWNNDFRPLNSPLPMLVVRSMMITDYPFLVSRRDWLYAYLKKFAPQLPSSLRWSIADRMVYHGDADAAITRNRV